MNEQPGVLGVGLPRVLVVDDQQTVRGTVGAALKHDNWEVVEAANGAAALAAIESQPFDLVILDILMSGVNGWAVLRRIRAHYSRLELPVVMLSTTQESDHTANPFEQGANDYVTKPIKAALFTARMRGHLLSKQQFGQATGTIGELSRKLTRDPITDLLNREALVWQLGELLAATDLPAQTHSICYLDLDHFQVVNSTLGSAEGDRLLGRVADVLREQVRGSDCVARLGDDEFIILLENGPLPAAIRVANKVRAALNTLQVDRCPGLFVVQASIGVVAIDGDSASVDELLEQCEVASQLARRNGGNRVHIMTADDRGMQERHADYRTLLEVNYALQNDAFTLYFQPIKPLAQSSTETQLSHFEILLRLDSGTEAPTAPGPLLSVVERYGLAEQLDNWVVQTALTACFHGTRSRDVTMCSINLSAQSLISVEFERFLTSQLNDPAVVPEKICFEITETAAVANLDAAIRFMEVFRQLGCRFALDDFGTGMASFSYLKSLPVDFVKIDGVFVKDMTRNSVDAALVRSMNDVAHALGKQTIAEWVEDEAIYDALRAIGVDFAQGYYLGKPAPLDPRTSVVPAYARAIESSTAR